MNFTGLKAEKMLGFFEEITKVPRPSGQEGVIADFLCSFLQERGLPYQRDDHNNVFAVMPSSAGREQEEPIMLQGHMDMVCEADSGVNWDIGKEGIRLLRDGDWLKADGTTLGGDDGFAVAVMLALLDGACPSHPRLECLFTTDEEVGLGGAKAFDFSPVTAKKLINLDSEEENCVLVSCAGGMRIDILSRYEWMDFDGCALRVTIDGLMGGHSGADIHLGRTSANRALAAALKLVCDRTRVNLAAFDGGSKDNAITRSASAVIGVSDLAAAMEALSAAEGAFRTGLSTEDAASAIFRVERCSAPEKMLSRTDSRQLCDFVSLLPFGALERNAALGIVETSCNLGIVHLTAEGAEISLLARSQDDAKLDHLDDVIEMLCVSYGAEKSVRSRYPGWPYNADSPLCRAYCNAFEQTAGYRPQVCGIHAGLECGIFKKKRPDMDMISIGADMKDVHTPRERMSVSSCDRIWQTLCRLLAE